MAVLKILTCKHGCTDECIECCDDEIARLKQWHAEIVALSAGWDDNGPTGPRYPLSWESAGRLAIDYARAALTPNAELSGPL